METRKKIEIVVAILILVVFIVALALFWRKPEEQVVVVNDNDSQLDASDDRETQVSEVKSEDIPPVSTVSATTIARTFVERFGSYSSESNFENVEDILSLATDSFQNDLNDIIEKARKNADGSYYGISTLIITTKTVSETDTAVTLRMTTQREEAIDDPANATVRYQDIVVNLVKIGDDWLIDGFTWQ